MPNEWIQSGVLGVLQPIMQKAHGRMVKLFYSKGLDYFTTSRREGDHMPGSFHPLGLAEDAALQRVSIEEISEVLGPGFDCHVFGNGKFFHYEYDPKKGEI
jgi:hypothetical protein